MSSFFILSSPFAEKTVSPFTEQAPQFLPSPLPEPELWFLPDLLPEPVYVYYHRPGSITTAPVSQKSFHFAAHTQAICQDIKARCPEILPQARMCLFDHGAHPALASNGLAAADAVRDFFS